MKIEEGMYVRYKRGMINGYVPPRIGKILERINDSEFLKINGNCTILENDVIKPSYDIIDLIEVGDYVNGYKVLEILVGNFDVPNPLNVKALKLEYVEQDINPKIPFFKRYIFVINKDIKNVVTHEQFDAMKYEVE